MSLLWVSLIKASASWHVMSHVFSRTLLLNSSALCLRSSLAPSTPVWLSSTLMLRFCLGPRHSTPRRSVLPWDALISAAAVSCCLTGMPSTSMMWSPALRPARPAGEQGEQSSTSRGQSPTMVNPKRPSGPGMTSICNEGKKNSNLRTWHTKGLRISPGPTGRFTDVNRVHTHVDQWIPGLFQDFKANFNDQMFCEISVYTWKSRSI